MDVSNLKKVFCAIARFASAVQENEFPHEIFKLLASEGLLSIVLPERPLSFKKEKTAELLSILMQTGKASLPAGRIYEGHINALYLIYLYGTPNQQELWFESASANQLFGVWNTEDAEGVHIIDKGNGRYVLKGSKTFCSGAQWLDHPLITGKLMSETRTGWQMCIIPREQIKIAKSDSSFWKPMGMQASVSYRMDLSGIELEKDDLLGDPDDYYRQPYFGGGSIRFAAVQLGGAAAIQEAVHTFINQMKRTEDPFQQARMAEIAYLVESGNLWIGNAGSKIDQWLKQPGTSEKILAYANMTRTVVEEICLKVMQLAERSVGSRGLMKPGDLERIHRDLTTYLRQPAPDTAIIAAGSYVFHQPELDLLWN